MSRKVNVSVLAGESHRQQRKATTEEWVGRVGDLYLGLFLVGWVIEVGTKLMARRCRRRRR
jgi:hypothetical protein